MAERTVKIWYDPEGDYLEVSLLSDQLPVGVLGPDEDCRDFHAPLLREGDENEAVPADTLAVPSSPLFPVEGLHIPLERIRLHPADRACDHLLLVLRQLVELAGGFGGETDSPGHAFSVSTASSPWPTLPIARA